MTLVILGTQDKEFTRLLVAVEKQIENGILNDVIVQTGNTKYESNIMQIIDFIPMEQFNTMISKADLIITHGGVGSILSGLRNNKKVIAIPRLSKYKEHENDHQKQIVDQFYKNGYILKCEDLNKLDHVIKESMDFVCKPYKGNNSKMIKIIEKFIDNI